MVATIQSAATEILPRYNALDKAMSKDISPEAAIHRATGAKTLEKAAKGEAVKPEELRNAANQLDIMAKKAPDKEIAYETRADANKLRGLAEKINKGAT